MPDLGGSAESYRIEAGGMHFEAGDSYHYIDGQHDFWFYLHFKIPPETDEPTIAVHHATTGPLSGLSLTVTPAARAEIEQNIRDYFGRFDVFGRPTSPRNPASRVQFDWRIGNQMPGIERPDLDDGEPYRICSWGMRPEVGESYRYTDRKHDFWFWMLFRAPPEEDEPTIYIHHATASPSGGTLNVTLLEQLEVERNIREYFRRFDTIGRPTSSSNPPVRLRFAWRIGFSGVPVV